MSSRSKHRCHIWVRAKKDHAHKKAVRKQQQHLREIKSEAALRQIMLNSRRGKK